MATKTPRSGDAPRLSRQYGRCGACGRGATDFDIAGPLTRFACTPCRRVWAHGSVAAFADPFAGFTVDRPLRPHRARALKKLRYWHAEIAAMLAALEGTP